MNSKTKFVFLSVFALLGLGIAAGSTVVDLGGNGWSDKPMYMEDAELSISHESVVEEKVRREQCIEYNESSLECLESEMQEVPGPKVEVIEFSEEDFEYLGNGEVRITFDAKLNNQLVSTTRVSKFNKEYFLNGKEPTSGELTNFYNNLRDLTFKRSGNSELKASSVSSNNVNAGQVKDLEFVVEMEEFRSGGVKLSEFATVEVETMNSNGGGQ